MQSNAIISICSTPKARAERLELAMQIILIMGLALTPWLESHSNIFSVTLFIWALGLCVSQRKKIQLDRSLRLYLWSVIFFLLIPVLYSLINEYDGYYVNQAARPLLTFIILAALMQGRHQSWLTYAFPLLALSFGLCAFVDLEINGSSRAGGLHNKIFFGNAAAVIQIICVYFFLKRQQRDAYVFLLGALISTYAVFGSGTRNAILCIAVLTPLTLFCTRQYWRGNLYKWIYLAVLFIFILCAAIFWSNAANRLIDLKQDNPTVIFDQNMNSHMHERSTGQRAVFFRTALKSIYENPMGISKEDYVSYMRELARNEEIPPFFLKRDIPHPHNQWLHLGVHFGFWGIGMLTLMGLGATLLLVRAPDSDSRFIGLLTLSNLGIACLTDVPLSWNYSMQWYCLLITLIVLVGYRSNIEPHD